MQWKVGDHCRHPDHRWNMTIAELDGETAKCEWIERGNGEMARAWAKFPLRHLRKIADIPDLTKQCAELGKRD